jgi:hypothetical protein
MKSPANDAVKNHFTLAFDVVLAMRRRPVFWSARSQPFGSQLVGWWSRPLDDAYSNR